MAKKEEKEVLFLRIPASIKDKIQKEAETRSLDMNTVILLLLQEKYGKK